jgi:hypothetical protein
MESKEIETGNKLIAEFMGDTKTVYGYPANKLREDMICYHSSWDWLMPVVEKIPKLNPDNGKLWFEYEILRCHCRIWNNGAMEWKNNSGTTISAVWLTAVQFITWYNQNKEK